MFPLFGKEVIDLTAATINAGAAIATLIQKTEEQGRSLGAREVLTELVGTTQENIGLHIKSLRALRNQLVERDVDMDKSLPELEGDVSWWRRRKYLAIRRFKRNVRGAVDNLSDIFQDIISLAHCRDAEDLITETSEEASDASEDLRNLLNSNPPVGVLIDHLISECESMRARFNDVLARGV